MHELEIDGIGMNRDLNLLKAGDIWVTLIPDTAVIVNASVGGPTSSIDGKPLILNEVLYITTSRPEPGPLVTSLTGLDVIAVRNLDIPDNATLETTLTVDSSVTIVDVNVTIDISHTRDADLDVFLVSPLGTSIQLFTDVGGDSDNFTGTTLDDQASTAITSGTAPFTGSFQPEGSLADFNTELAGGVWTLRITDDLAGEIGTLNHWSLTVTGTDNSVETFTASPAHIYGINTAQDSLVVINGDDGTQRQLFVEGNKAINFAGSTVTLDGLNGATDVVVSSDGLNVYVTSPLEEGIATFRRDPATGNLTYMGISNQDNVSGIRLESLAIGDDPERVFATGTFISTPVLIPYTRNATSGALTRSGGGSSSRCAVTWP